MGFETTALGASTLAAIIAGWLTQKDLRAVMPRPAGLSVGAAQRLAAIDEEVDAQEARGGRRRGRRSEEGLNT